MNILLIGNSHTYVNDMPALVREMAESASGEECHAFMLAYSGRSLKWHIEEEYFSERFNILYGGYDYCVIQEQAHPLPPEEDTVAYAGRIIDLCKKAGTVPIIFETWAEKAKPENQTEMNRRYRTLAAKTGARLAPVGEVWSAVSADLKDASNADLYFRDGEHASPVGDYLIAMVLTKTITGRLPERNFLKAFDFSVPERFQPVKESASDETVSIPPEIAETIRRRIETQI
ncbi:MAG: hypothetical protein IJK89_03595 [Clostridia bacterium]|nr:hypothetical protein [Clostridia bacterium]